MPQVHDHSSGTKLAAGRIASINCSDGGVPKALVGQALITEIGVAGDRQRNTRLHGGPDRAVTLYSLERIQALAREGHPIAIGATGENLTISDLDWNLVIPGVAVGIGEVRLLITKYTKPCLTIRNSFIDQDQNRISQDLHPGWSRVCARVLAGGTVTVGDPVVLL